MNQIKINKILLTKLFIIFCYLTCWLSISTTFQDLLIFKKDILSFNQIINFMRHFLIYFCFFSLLFLIMLGKIKIYFKENLSLIFFILYFLLQIPGLIFSTNKIDNISFIVSSLTILITIFFINEYFSNKEKKLFIFISLFFLTLVFLLSFTTLLKEYLQGSNNLYGQFVENTKFFFNKDSPRSSGLSRSCLIIIMIIYMIEKSFFHKNKIIFEILKIFFLTVIFLFQSRTIIFLTFISHTLIFIFQSRYSLKNTLKFLSLYFLIPFTFTVLFMGIYTYQKHKLEVNKTIEFNKEFGEVVDNLEAIEMDYPLREYNDFTSGRIKDWKEILAKINTNNIFFGSGPQADRFLINQSASNGILYSLISSGIIGLLFYILFSIIVFFEICKTILNYREKRNMYFYSCLIILIIMLRSILETSYAVFGIDLIVLITFYNIIKKQKLKI